MDNHRSPRGLFYQNRGISPKKSPIHQNVQKRRLDIERSERAAYWALFNTSVAILIYYDLCYLKCIEDISTILVSVEWLVCGLFTISASYDFFVHFWPYTFMRPIPVTPHDKKLLGIQEDELGFRVEEPTVTKSEPTYINSIPPFEIHHSFEDDKIVTPPKKLSTSADTSLNTSRRSRITDKEALVEYLKNCQILEDQAYDNHNEYKHQQSFHSFGSLSFDNSFR